MGQNGDRSWACANCNNKHCSFQWLSTFDEGSAPSTENEKGKHSVTIELKYESQEASLSVLKETLISGSWEKANHAKGQAQGIIAKEEQNFKKTEFLALASLLLKGRALIEGVFPLGLA